MIGISTFLSEHYAELHSLAQTWLSNGASSFSLWQHDQLLAAWPSDEAVAAAGIQAPIVLEREAFGSLRITGIVDAAARRRLQTDAHLLAGLLRRTEQLHQANEVLTASHDQLLAAYETLRDIHDQASVEYRLRRMAVEAMRLTDAEGSFALLVPAKSAPTLITCPSPHLNEEAIWSLYWRTQADPQFTAEQHDNLQGMPKDVRGILLTSLSIEPETTLLLGLLNRAHGSFSPRDRRLAQVIAQQTAARIGEKFRAEEQVLRTRLQAEVELARRVQALLMPQRRPTVQGLDISGRIRPALPVGGDFYDFIELPGRPFLFSVGDVVGKGISAAMLMTMTRGAIHSKASFMPNPSPALVMRNSNSDLCDDFSQVGTFATALVGQYNAAERALILANAGHSPVIYRPHGGAPQLLRAQSTALGILAISRCENEILDLGPGDLLVVGTDGLSDARDQHGDSFGLERILDLVDQLAARTAEGIGDGLFTAIDRFVGQRAQDDDQTLVVIKGVDA